MPLISHKLVASVSTALFGSLVVFGYALHALPGLNHSCGCDCVFHERIALGQADGSEEPGCRRAVGHTDGDCPICSFFSMAKTVTVALLGDAAGGPVAPLMAADYQPLASATPAFYAARGPPVRFDLLG